MIIWQYMVDRIHNNYALQIVANSFLANPTTSATFATILVEYLLARLEEMGCMYSNIDMEIIHWINIFLKIRLYRLHLTDNFRVWWTYNLINHCNLNRYIIQNLVYLKTNWQYLLNSNDGSFQLVSEALQTGVWISVFVCCWKWTNAQGVCVMLQITYNTREFTG